MNVRIGGPRHLRWFVIFLGVTGLLVLGVVVFGKLRSGNSPAAEELRATMVRCADDALTRTGVTLNTADRTASDRTELRELTAICAEALGAGQIECDRDAPLESQPTCTRLRQGTVPIDEAIDEATRVRRDK